MSKLANALITYNDDNDFIIQYLDRSHETGAIGAKSDYPFDNPDAKKMVQGWDYDLDRLMAAAMIQAVALVRFIGTEGEEESKEDFDQRLTDGDFDTLSLALLGWACVCLVSGDMNDGLLTALEPHFTDKDKWITALANILTYHGWQFNKVYPEEFEVTATE